MVGTFGSPVPERAPHLHGLRRWTSLKAALAKGCKVPVYGVNFDFNKATLRPDAKPVLEQVLALFKDDRALKVGSVGTLLLSWDSVPMILERTDLRSG